MKININDSDNTKQLEGGLIQLTDANGKEIQVKIDDIIDASTILSSSTSILEDGEGSRPSFSLEITDNEGEIVDEQTLIADVKSGQAVCLDVTFEATHSGGNKNHTVYSSDSMAEDSRSWMYPFAKPLIKNHDMYEEPIGRVIDSTFAQSEFDPNRDTINLTFRVSDQDAMVKFADGRYKTMSIGATAGHIQCNVCGKDILKDGKFKFCGHWRGEAYANQVATWTAKNLEYKEGSVVNNPADSLAQVKRIKVIKAKEGSTMSNSVKNNTDGTIAGTLDDIDNLIDGENTTATEGVVNDNTPVDNGDNQEPTIVNDNEGQGEGSEPELTDAEKLEVANAKIADLEAKIEELKHTIATKDAELTSKEDEVTAKDSEIETLKGEATVKDEELVKVKDQAKRLAVLNKNMLIDTLKSVNSDITDEEIAGKSAKELHQMISDAKEAAKGRGMVPQINNPGAAVNDSNTIIDNGDVADNKEEKKEYTMKDMEDVLINTFFKN